MNCSSTNGRLDLSEPNIQTQFSLYDKIPVGKSCETFHDALVGNLIESNLSRAF